MSLVLNFDAEIEKSRGRAPRPPAGEQEGRFQRAREAMARRGLDALLVYGSAEVNADPIRYLSGYVHVFPSASSLLAASRRAYALLGFGKESMASACW